MIVVKYEEYTCDYWRKDKTETFGSLAEVGDWIFNQMQQNYSDPDKGWLYMSFCVNKKSGKPWDEPDRISFSPKYGGPDFWIHEMLQGGRIIFSDGKYTAGKKHWSESVQKWCIECWKRQYHPDFDFAE